MVFFNILIHLAMAITLDDVPNNHLGCSFQIPHPQVSHSKAKTWSWAWGGARVYIRGFWFLYMWNSQELLQVAKIIQCFLGCLRNNIFLEHATQNPNQTLLRIGVFVQSEVHMHLCMIKYIKLYPPYFLLCYTFNMFP